MVLLRSMVLGMLLLGVWSGANSVVLVTVVIDGGAGVLKFGPGMVLHRWECCNVDVSVQKQGNGVEKYRL